jgi:hypothetical protein
MNMNPSNIKKYLRFHLTIYWANGMSMHETVSREVPYEMTDVYIRKCLVPALAVEKTEEAKKRCATKPDNFSVCGITIERTYSEQYHFQIP